MPKALTRQRLQFWLKDPRCYYCKVVTVFEYPKGTQRPDNYATIDHLRPRHHPLRREPANGDIRHVLACFRCNNDRDKRELSEKPKEWFYENGGSKPLTMKTTTELQQAIIRIERGLASSLAASNGRNARRKRVRARLCLSAIQEELSRRVVSA
jgi:hypothetical protein